jgi:UDP-glucose 4-epimerase
MLEENIGGKAEVTYVESKPGDVRHSLADIAEAGRILGYEPKVMFHEGLRRTIEGFL